MTDTNTTETPARRGGGTSREVNCFAVHRFLAPHLGDPDVIPGTPSWTQLPDDDAAKWRAVLWSAMWWAISEDARQNAIADAGEQVSAAQDWSQVSRDVHRRHEIDQLRRSA